jgi:mannose-6-phosphate isomerase-like protein (cupin superfamily)
MILKTEYHKIKSYITKDGSIIRELFHPDTHGNKNQSLAEAVIPAGSVTLLHRHGHSEEIYYITEGTGLMTVDNKQFNVVVGDAICILPGKSHCIKNITDIPLKLLCCCSPPYSHEDTEIITDIP